MDILIAATIAQVMLKDVRYAVELKLKNVSDEVQLIDPAALCAADKRLENAVFRITDAEGKKVRYTGKRAKRDPKRDFSRFVELKPGHILTRRCKLDAEYALEGAPAPFGLKYSVFNPHPDPDVPLQKIESNTIRLE